MFYRVEVSFSGPSKVQGPMSKPDSVGCYGQLNGSSLHKQTRRKPLGGDVRSPVENHDLVPSLPVFNLSLCFLEPKSIRIKFKFASRHPFFDILKASVQLIKSS